MTNAQLQILEDKFGSTPLVIRVHGGSINEVYRVQFKKTLFCCKIQSATRYPSLFKLEAEGLHHLRERSPVKTPEVVMHFQHGDEQFLIMEWISSQPFSDKMQNRFGVLLAQMHQAKSKHFGYVHSNYMGALPQSNEYSDDWSAFFKTKRINPLVQQALDKGLLQLKEQKQFEHLMELLPEIFDASQPCLLHGDLWSGNVLNDIADQPVLIDPAVYYGHPAMDLAMTTLFGGFDKNFYEAYAYHNRLPNNYKAQWEVANLYPLLIHLLLFGNAYKNQITSILNKYNN